MEKLITKLEVQKNNKNRVNIYLDEEFAFACSTDLVYYYNLENGKKINIDLLKEIIEEDNYIKGKSAALKLIEKSYKSEKEIYDKLITKGYEEKTIVRILNFLKQYNFINDEKYAEMFIKEKLSSYGKDKIKYLLLKKGIDEKIIEDKLSSISEYDEKEQGIKLARKKYASLISSERSINKIYKKLGDYLIGRGYNFDLVNSILKEVIQNKDYEDENYIKDEFTEEEKMDELRKIAEKRYKILLKSEDNYVKIYKKLGMFLARKGYSWEEINKTLKEIVEDE